MTAYYSRKMGVWGGAIALRETPRRDLKKKGARARRRGEGRRSPCRVEKGGASESH